MEFSGSPQHIIAVEDVAQKRDLSLNTLRFGQAGFMEHVNVLAELRRQFGTAFELEVLSPNQVRIGSKLGFHSTLVKVQVCPLKVKANQN